MLLYERPTQHSVLLGAVLAQHKGHTSEWQPTTSRGAQLHLFVFLKAEKIHNEAFIEKALLFWQFQISRENLIGICIPYRTCIAS